MINSKKIIVYLITGVVIFLAVMFGYPIVTKTNVQLPNPNVANPLIANTPNPTPTPPLPAAPTPDRPAMAEPIGRAISRVTKKPFGIKISPTSSPVSPERFSGYHTGVDFEVSEEELNLNVPVFAICMGPLGCRCGREWGSWSGV